jgi:hypothetical protein
MTLLDIDSTAELCNLAAGGISMSNSEATARSVLRCAIVSIAMLLSGCATPSYNYLPAVKDVSAPPVGSTATVGVGDKMLEQGHYQEIDGIRLSETVKVGLVGTYTFNAGDYAKKGENSQGEFFLPGNFPGSGSVEKGALTDPFQTMLLKPDGSTLCGVSIFGAYVCHSNVKVERIKVPSLTANAFQQTLIYSGKVGNKINIGYREFSGDMARPAFNNDVEYDLSESKTIGYKGARLEIIEATNDHITYRVDRNFNSPLPNLDGTRSK